MKVFRSMPVEEKMRRRLRRRLRKAWAALARLTRPEEVWRDKLSDEIEFRYRYLSTKGLLWPAEFRMRIDPESDVQGGFFAEYLRRVGSAYVSILDVGAGPLTAIGKRYPGKRVAIKATDALAHENDGFWRRRGLSLPYGP
jgi:hypothetical protein